MAYSSAYESALSGSMEGNKKNGQVYETAKMCSEKLGSTGFFGAENLTTQTNVGKEVQVTYDLDTISVYGGLNWHMRTEGKSQNHRSCKSYPQDQSCKSST